MHFCDGLAAPCMGGGAWVGARCWLAGRGHVLFVLGSPEPVTSLLYRSTPPDITTSALHDAAAVIIIALWP